MTGDWTIQPVGPVRKTSTNLLTRSKRWLIRTDTAALSYAQMMTTI
ncbi:hypothetical protein BH10CYA1_BH10CYA1_03140 [soil metagenome]